MPLWLLLWASGPYRYMLPSHWSVVFTVMSALLWLVFPWEKSHCKNCDPSHEKKNFAQSRNRLWLHNVISTNLSLREIRVPWLVNVTYLWHGTVTTFSLVLLYDMKCEKYKHFVENDEWNHCYEFIFNKHRAVFHKPFQTKLNPYIVVLAKLFVEIIPWLLISYQYITGSSK